MTTYYVYRGVRYTKDENQNIIVHHQSLREEALSMHCLFEIASIEALMFWITSIVEHTTQLNRC